LAESAWMRFRESIDEIFAIRGSGLKSDHLHDTKHILCAMIDLAHEKTLLFLALLRSVIS
jgi:hypothetical protein